MADNFTLEQQQAIAIAKAKAKAVEAGEDTASWSDVLKQAPVKAAAMTADTIANTPENLGNLLQAGNQMFQAGMAPESYHPEDAPEVTTPDNTATEYLTGQGFIDPNLRNNMSPGQKIADTAIQGATGALFGGGAGVAGVARNALVGGLSNAAGEAVTQTTGSEGLGLATSMLSPVGASKILSLNKARDEAQALNALRDTTNKEAQDLGFVVVPETEVAKWANRPKMLEAAAGINQRKTNDVARQSLDIPSNIPLSKKVLDGIRGNLYNRGYMPLKKLGVLTTDDEYLDDLYKIEARFTGAKNSFPDDVPPQFRELVDRFLVDKVDSGDVVDKIRALRNSATKNIKSKSPVNNEYGFAQQQIVDALENLMERGAVKAGWPSTMVDNYREARKLIAVSHTIGNALNSADGNVNMFKLGKMLDRGQYMDGDLAKVAKFASINKPKNLPQDERLPFSYMAGGTAGFALASALDLPPWTAGALVSGSALAARGAHHALSTPVREYLLSKPGQLRSQPDYTSLGIDPRSGALGGLTFENAQGAK